MTRAPRAARRGYVVGKRIVDVVAALTLLVLLSPVMIAVAALVRAKLGSPVLFRQRRPGLGGRPFVMLKFRTMRDAVDAAGVALPDADRLTSLGRTLRATSLDELPGLVNVLRGEMSLVGPRPLLMEYLPLYSAEQRRRHDVKPGLTGLAQVSGRNAIGWPERLALDVWYVDHASMRLDLAILLKTLVRVVRREGIDQPGGVTMTPFRGEPSA